MTASETNGDANRPAEKNGETEDQQQTGSSGSVSSEKSSDIEPERRTGVCKWFNVLKGFGFIVLDGTNEDVFVHQSELKMEGFRSLEEGERVAFFVRTRNSGQRAGALEAFQVGPEDDSKPLKGSSIRPLGSKKDRLIRCYKCGRFGNHMAQRCKKIEANQKVCYGCGADDHLLGACTKVARRSKPGAKEGEAECREEIAQES
ncbi:hypothetical protein Q1695_014312 [Nippostrongylus brasiliensis]|nr:hypothetical protein Q1695_014312 [Nippostrongylus brasiliensis]